MSDQAKYEEEHKALLQVSPQICTPSPPFHPPFPSHTSLDPPLPPSLPPSLPPPLLSLPLSLPLSFFLSHKFTKHTQMQKAQAEGGKAEAEASERAAKLEAKVCLR